MTQEDVTRLIESAWRDAAHPGNDTLAGRPDYCSPSEYAYVAAFFKDRPWTQVTLDALRKDYEGPPDACLSFMSGEALRYYLPAFMLIAVRDYDTADIVCDSAVAALTPPTYHPQLYELAKQQGTPDQHNPCSEANVARQREWWNGRVAGLTWGQRQAILAFLDYMLEVHGPDFATDVAGPKQARDYWAGQEESE